MLNKNIVRLAGTKIDLCILRTDPDAIELYTKWQNDEKINMWIGNNASISQYAEEEEWANTIQNKTGSCQFTIVEKYTGRMIGICSCGCYDGISAYLGITIGEHDALGRGYGTEAVKMLVKFCFEEMNAHRVALALVSENERALKCYKKVGFVECGHDTEAVYYHGHYCDNIRMEILRSNWNES